MRWLLSFTWAFVARLDEIFKVRARWVTKTLTLSGRKHGFYLVLDTLCLSGLTILFLNRSTACLLDQSTVICRVYNNITWREWNIYTLCGRDATLDDHLHHLVGGGWLCWWKWNSMGGVAAACLYAVCVIFNIKSQGSITSTKHWQDNWGDRLVSKILCSALLRSNIWWSSSSDHLLAIFHRHIPRKSLTNIEDHVYIVSKDTPTPRRTAV